MPHILMYTCQIVDHLHGSHASDNSQSFDKLSLPNAYPLLTVLIYLTKSRNYSGATHLDVCVKHNLHQCHLPGIPHYVGCGYFYQIFFFFYIWSVYHSFSHVQVCWGWLCRSWKIEYSALPSTILGKHLYHWTLFWEVNFCLQCNQVFLLVFPLIFPCIPCISLFISGHSRLVQVATQQSSFSSRISSCISMYFQLYPYISVYFQVGSGCYTAIMFLLFPVTVLLRGGFPHEPNSGKVFQHHQQNWHQSIYQTYSDEC